MTTSSTSSLPLATSTTSNLPPATSTTSNLPPATSTTSNLPPVTSTTSNLPSATSLTSQLHPATSLTNHLLPSISTTRASNINEADLFVVSVIGDENLLIEAEIEELDDVTMNEEVEGNVNLEPGGTQYVHGTSDDIKNHIRDVNAFIGESDAQMLINKMENRKNFVPNFTFHYLVKNSKLVAMLWADEVAKCNYKEFGDIILFDATFRTNK
nr:hypothetical protein [Tanacetum cinerariifolium]